MEIFKAVIIYLISEYIVQSEQTYWNHTDSLPQSSNKFDAFMIGSIREADWWYSNELEVGLNFCKYLYGKNSGADHTKMEANVFD